jgi:hypothetical protein
MKLFPAVDELLDDFVALGDFTFLMLIRSVYREAVPVERYIEKDEAEEYSVKQHRPLTTDLKNYSAILSGQDAE